MLEQLLRARYSELQAALPLAVGSPATELPSGQAELLQTYLELLERWSRRIDLVAPAPPEVLAERHIVDSLAAHLLLESRLVQAPGEQLLDVGSGAGLPGIVLAVCAPKRQVVLCEPREKRVQFLKEARRVLGLANVEILRSRVEDIQELSRLKVMLTRALGSHGFFLTEAHRLLPSSGSAIQLLGPTASAEALRTHSPLRLYEDLHYTLGQGGAERQMLIWQK